MTLARLERVQADQQTTRFEDGALAHLVGPPLGFLSRLDHVRMLHTWVTPPRPLFPVPALWR